MDAEALVWRIVPSFCTSRKLHDDVNDMWQNIDLSTTAVLFCQDFCSVHNMANMDCLLQTHNCLHRTGRTLRSSVIGRMGRISGRSLHYVLGHQPRAFGRILRFGLNDRLVALMSVSLRETSNCDLSLVNLS
jgi:hypothetical protein